MYAEPEQAVQHYIDALLIEDIGALAGRAEQSHRADIKVSKSAAAEAGEQDNSGIQVREPIDVQGEQTQSPVSGAGMRSEAFVRHLELAQQGGLSTRQGAVSPYPEWASEAFECLVVSVANLKLAIPSYFVDSWAALDLSSVQRKEQGIFVALDSAEQVKLVDAAKLILPERYQPEMRAGYCYRINFKQCELSLAVDDIVTTTTYQPNKIRWRGMHTRRFWLAGTYIEDMCALLDVDALHREVLAHDVLEPS